ncbi:unnamed protein product [Polarella glacialis]|uniref:Uncharacterized protein n=1 Tax=Polarella glacialis TaxID=89957 RepID=A0A813LLI8_POLGL|nr:unnamed protein product [Polarella glacialis]
MVFQTAVHSAVSYFLNHYFEEWVDGLHQLDCSRFPITLRNLKLKERKFQEGMDDAAFAFQDGGIGAVRMNVSWSGEIQVTATDVTLNFSFSPYKLMRRAFQGPETEKDHQEAEDDEEDQENHVPLDVQQRLAAVYPSTGTSVHPVHPCFCAKHNASENRTKAEPHCFQCRSCKIMGQTNYAETVLCPSCSDRQKRCMCCGTTSVNPGPQESGASGRPRQERRVGRLSESGPVGAGPAEPVFCARHATSEQRPKTEPTTRECRACFAHLQTNYRDFALCPECSRKELRCMLCSNPGPSFTSPGSGESHLRRGASPNPRETAASRSFQREAVDVALPPTPDRQFGLGSSDRGAGVGGVGDRSRGRNPSGARAHPDDWDGLPPPPPPMPHRQASLSHEERMPSLPCTRLVEERNTWDSAPSPPYPRSPLQARPGSPSIRSPSLIDSQIGRSMRAGSAPALTRPPGSPMPARAPDNHYAAAGARQGQQQWESHPWAPRNL